MKKKNLRKAAWLGLGLAAGLCVPSTQACDWGELKAAENQAPVVEGILVNGEEQFSPCVREGNKVSLQAVVWDPNGDEFAGEDIVWSFSDGEVDGASTGPSVIWTSPFVVWENPPQEVLVDVNVAVSDGKGGEGHYDLTVCVLPPCRSDNQAPLIRSITADPDSIDLGQTTTITADVEDAEGDPITYEWTVPFGYFEGNGPQIRWTTTETCCDDNYTIQLLASDGCDTSWGRGLVWVEVP